MNGKNNWFYHFFMVLGIEPRTLHLVGKCFTMELWFLPISFSCILWDRILLLFQVDLKLVVILPQSPMLVWLQVCVMTDVAIIFIFFYDFILVQFIFAAGCYWSCYPWLLSSGNIELRYHMQGFPVLNRTLSIGSSVPHRDVCMLLLALFSVD